MLDSNWKTWGLVGLVALGLSFEVIKKLPGQDYVLVDNELIQSAGPTEPFAVRIKNLLLGKSTKPKRKKLRVAGASAIAAENAPAAINSSEPANMTNGQDEKPQEGAKTDEKKKKTEEKCDENNPKIDPQTGQPVPCKKKKKKKSAEAKEEIKPVAKAQDHHHEDSLDQLMGNAIATGQLPQPVGKKAETFDSLEEWERRLLNSPDRSMTKIFIDHHNRGLVSDEIYFSITAMMLEDSRSDMKQLGVLCAGLEPSVPAFQLLAQLVDKEFSGSPARRDAERFLETYEDMSRLAILERILRSSNINHATYLAAQRLDASIRKNLVLDDPATSAGKGQTNLERAAAQFKRFVVVLEALLQTKDAALNELAKNTLSHLQSIYSQQQTSQTDPNTPPIETAAQSEPTAE